MPNPRLPTTMLVSICLNSEGKLEEVVFSGSDRAFPKSLEDNPTVRLAFSLGSDRIELVPPLVARSVVYHKLENSDTSQPGKKKYISRTIRYVRI